MKKLSFNKECLVQFVMIAIVAVCLLPIMSKECLLFDESFTINLVRKGWKDIIYFTSLDVHPPLYYLVVKLFVTLFGGANAPLFVWHLTSFLFYIGLLLMSAWFFHKYFDARLSLFVTIMLCSVPNMLPYALQLRMYSMCMFFVAASFYLVYIIIDNVQKLGAVKFDKHWCLLMLVNVATAYTHYFAAIAVVGSSLFLLVYLLFLRNINRKAMLKTWALHVLGMFVLYLPWIPVLLRQMSDIDGNYWILPLTEAALHEYPGILFEMDNPELKLLLMVLFVIGFFLLVYVSVFEKKYLWLWGCYGVVLFWFVLLIGYSVIRNPVLVDRYMVMLLPLFWIPVIAGYRYFNDKMANGLVFILLTLCFITNYDSLYNRYARSNDIVMNKYIEENMPEDAVFFDFYIQTLSINSAYFPSREQYGLDTVYNGQAFKHWEEMLDCTFISSLEELQISGIEIWCKSGDYIQSFEECGFQVIMEEVGTENLYIIYYPQ